MTPYTHHPHMQEPYEPLSAYRPDVRPGAGWAALIGFLALLLTLASAYSWLTGYRDDLRELAGEPLCEQWLEEIELETASGDYRQALELISGLRLNYPASSQAWESRAFDARALLGLAEQEMDRGEYDSAKLNLHILLKDHPSSPEAETARALYPAILLAIARENAASGQYQTALSTLDQLVSEYPASAEAAESAALRSEVYGLMLDQGIAQGLDLIDRAYPGQVTARISSVRYRIEEAPEDDFTAGSWTSYYNLVTLYSPSAFSYDLEEVLMHEWGHVVDYFFLSAGEEAEYRRLRGIPESVPWHNYHDAETDEDGYRSSPDEDFAEVFATVNLGEKWSGHTVYGEIADPGAMQLWMVAVSSN